MKRKYYIKPEMEELLDAGMSLLAGSGLGTDTEQFSPTRQEGGTFTEDEEDE